MKTFIFALLLVATSGLGAAQKPEDMLREQLAQTQNALVAAQRDRASIEAQLAASRSEVNANLQKLKEGTVAAAHSATVAAQAATKEVNANSDANADSVTRQVSGQTSAVIRAGDAAAQAAIDAGRDAAAARAQQAQLSNQTTSLVIIQSFGFAIVVVGFIYKAFEHHWDAAAARQAREDARQAQEDAAASRKQVSARLTQIHTLVNSSLTAAKQAELDSRHYNLILLLEAVAQKRKNGEEPPPETLAIIDATQAKINDLAREVEERLKFALEAEAQLKVDLKEEGT